VKPAEVLRREITTAAVPDAIHEPLTSIWTLVTSPLRNMVADLTSRSGRLIAAWGRACWAFLATTATGSSYCRQYADLASLWFLK